MSEVDATIQFAYDLQTPGNSSEALPHEASGYAEFKAWRSILFTLDLIGQHPDRNGGYAYGNLSFANPPGFVITASQSSGTPTLEPEDLVQVTHASHSRFWIEALGSRPPSSDAMTHAAIYQMDPRVRFIFHIHSDEVWSVRDALNLPETPEDVAPASPEMAQAAAQLMQTHQSRPLVFAAAADRNSIFALSHHIRDCGGLLVSYLAKARALNT